MKHFRKLLAVLLLCLILPASTAHATQQVSLPERYYTIYSTNGETLCRIGGEVFEDDEYISGDNQLYRITSVDATNYAAYAEHLGEEPAVTMAAFQSQARTLASAKDKKLIGIYCTHSDESYVPTDGNSNTEGRGGIYDVAHSLAKSLNDLGIETIVDETMHHPHDAGAYRRSQSTAASLIKKGPDALIDVHRDGVPADEYDGKINGEKGTMVRLLVGKRNSNSAANREFAKQLKAVADKRYPGLIKDIFIGKGSYNQELMPHSILMEFGTYESDKNSVIKSAPYMAEIISLTLYGETGSAVGKADENTSKAPMPTADTTGEPAAQQQSAEGLKNSSKGSGSGIAWIIGLFAVGLVAVGLLVGGKTGLGGRISRTVNEMTSGLFGKKPPRN